ncbi:MAG: ECF transporter S component [Hungatella sp.]|nr:ECF transporter S component [Hungatella sp.]
MKTEKLLNVKNVVLMAMFGAIGAVLMLFEFPLPFIAPPFYGLDLSEIPVLVGTFAMGPLAGVVTEVVKILIKLVLKPTSTGFVGEFANICIGWALVLPAGFLYKFKKTKKGAILGMAVGTCSMAAVGAVMNALVMLPFYSNFMPLEDILAAGAAINPAIGNVWTFVLLAVAPFNLIKGALVSVITALVYKRISVIIHGSSR